MKGRGGEGRTYKPVPDSGCEGIPAGADLHGHYLCHVDPGYRSPRDYKSYSHSAFEGYPGRTYEKI